MNFEDMNLYDELLPVMGEEVLGFGITKKTSDAEEERRRKAPILNKVMQDAQEHIHKHRSFLKKTTHARHKQGSDGSASNMKKASVRSTLNKAAANFGVNLQDIKVRLDSY